MGGYLRLSLLVSLLPLMTFFLAAIWERGGGREEGIIANRPSEEEREEDKGSVREITREREKST